MRKNIILAALFMLAISFTPALADSGGLFTGNLTTADAVGTGVGYFGGFVGFGDNMSTVYGTFTYGMAEYTDIRFKLGFSDIDYHDSDPKIMLGFDFKYEIMDYDDTLHKNPFDFAAGAFLEYADYDYSPMLEFGGNLIGSIPYRFKSGQKLIPYARINVRMERIDPEWGDANTDFEAGMNLGAKFEMTTDFNLYGEFELDGNTGIYLGLEVRAF
ncbi:MAG: hypothetical protein AB1746_15035 [Candidatus Zixiibacteriota bacterium]